MRRRPSGPKTSKSGFGDRREALWRWFAGGQSAEGRLQGRARLPPAACAGPLDITEALATRFVLGAGVITCTDSETWAGHVHPSQAPRLDREEFVSDAKAAVVGMISNGFTLTDPNDRGMLDGVGFDASVPAIISAFVRSRRANGSRTPSEVATTTRAEARGFARAFQIEEKPVAAEVTRLKRQGFQSLLTSAATFRSNGPKFPA